MSKLFTLGPRLQKCAAFIRPGARVADIGTDHGYLPIWLVKTGHASSVIAADIGEGPLSAAKANARKYEAPLTAVLSDGFERIDPASFDDAVLAGMGGELMVKIISRADFLKDGGKRLILQPMTSAPELRRYLSQTGFIIEREEAVKDDGKIYSVMGAAYKPEKAYLSEMEIYMGKIRPHSQGSRAYAAAVAARLANMLLGFEHRQETANAEKLRQLIQDIENEYLDSY